MTSWLNRLYALLWGPPAVIFMVGAGSFLSLRLGLPQVTLFPRALRSLTAREKKAGAVTPFQALCTALAATVGTGNIIGVSGAICLGGPGAVFWMWLCGFVGMATKFAEVTLAGHYRVLSGGELVGGPMYMIQRGLPRKWHFLAYLYSAFGVVAAFGVGNATQVNAVVSGVNGILAAFGREESLFGNLAVGFLMAAAVGAVLFGGVRRIGAAAERLVPAVFRRVYSAVPLGSGALPAAYSSGLCRHRYRRVFSQSCHRRAHRLCLCEPAHRLCPGHLHQRSRHGHGIHGLCGSAGCRSG